MFTIAELEAAINHCLAHERVEENSIPPDARDLANVYGSMIFYREESRSLTSMKESERIAFKRWQLI